MTLLPKEILERFLEIKVESDEFTQALINIDKKSRSSLFRWKGQFSPQLVEHILEENILPGYCVLDPFCGSGTTIYESARKEIKCFGADVNPATYIFSSSVNFCQVEPVERKKIITEVRHIADCDIPNVECTLFNSKKTDLPGDILRFYNNI